MGLVIELKQWQTVKILVGDLVCNLTIVRSNHGKLRLYFDAPKEFTFQRQKYLDKIAKEAAENDGA